MLAHWYEPLHGAQRIGTGAGSVTGTVVVVGSVVVGVCVVEVGREVTGGPEARRGPEQAALPATRSATRRASRANQRRVGFRRRAGACGRTRRSSGGGACRWSSEPDLLVGP